ncbi:MAG TPA: patatin-like phospholipase family protein [Thermoanaerobaculia bacterium]|jgi:NTE family protein|nr:patatin-like phospholipase family protein [Thermoanaerobaculia bacterium]
MRRPDSRRFAFALALVGLAAGTGCRSTRFACPVVGPPVPVAKPSNCPPPHEYPWKNLVFEGGGIKGLAYGGALEVLSEQGILPNVTSVAGTSAGSITAMLVALRYSPDQIRQLLVQLNFGQLEDGGSTGAFRLFRRYGFYRGDTYLELMRCMVEGKTGTRRATFRDLHDKGFLDLRVFTSDLNTGDVRELSYRKSPDFEVALAVRMSGSFPIFFASIENERKIFVDGGVVLNYPVNAFDREKELNPETLGFVLVNTNSPPPVRKIDGILTYGKGLFETLLSAQVVGLEHDPANLERTVVLNDLGISTLDFDLTPKQKQELIDQGAKCTCLYLRDYSHWTDGGRHPGHEVLLSAPPGTAVVPIRQTGHCGSAFPIR